jgi:AcrR family transcriptional regulator
VSEQPTRDTRTAILNLARELFAQYGYQRTSLRELGERLGLSKAAVLYHFPTKPDILAALAEPLLVDLEAALTKAAATTPGTRQAIRWAAIEGVLDALLAHRQSLHMVLHDLALLSGDRVFRWFTTLIVQAQRLVSGPDPDVAGRVRASQAIAMLSDPAIQFTDVPVDQLRKEVLAGVRRLFTEPGAAGAANPQRRGPGRPNTLTPAQIASARASHARGTHTVDELAASLGVSRATMYRYLA